VAKLFRESDVNPSLIKDRRVAVLGYGSQGHAHALNLRDSGVDVRVGLYAESPSRQKARNAGLFVGEVEEVTAWADVVMFCTPDVEMADIYCKQVLDHLRTGQTLLFAHGFNIHYGLIKPPANVAVAMVSPKGPGPKLRSEFQRGSGLPALVAVHQDPRGDALDLALSYAWGIGCARLLILETTFKEETETDLFGEQAVLCGGISALVKAGFETLVQAGYQPEAAYFECFHETKLIVDLLVEGGLTLMREKISDTAEWGDYVAGDKVINHQSRLGMQDLLADIQSGEFARRWVQENRAGRPEMNSRREIERSLQIENVGRDLRERMGLQEPVSQSDS
jgi:ketol-acid reductoisomerase